MNINHEPLFDAKKVIEHYEEKDGVAIKYICTTDLRASDVPVDVFYRESPHPEFGNRYFGLYYDNVRGHMMITNADIVEELEFGMIEHEGKYYYSQSHHDYKAITETKFIDGGRMYVRHNPNEEFFKLMKVKNGKFIVHYGDDLADMVGNYYYPGGDCQV